MYRPISNLTTGSRGMSRAAGILLLALLYGCASSGDQSANPRAGADPSDPLESINRVVYRFNDTVDRKLLRPVAEKYQEYVPAPIDRSVTNFFSNIDDVVIIANDILQVKFEQAASDTARVFFNSTIGLLGVFDVATPMEFYKHQEDFGQTLGYWGVPPGPYIVLPLLGPSNVRDTLGRVADAQINPLKDLQPESHRYALNTLRVVDLRADLLTPSKLLDEAALDPYIFLRDAYFQRRENQVYDGNPPLPDFD